MGWARKVGHQVVASQEYFERCAMDNYIATDCTPDMFPEYRPPPGNFVAGMKLEAVDPLNLATVCVATVMKVGKVFSRETSAATFPRTSYFSVAVLPTNLFFLAKYLLTFF